MAYLVGLQGTCDAKGCEREAKVGLRPGAPDDITPWLRDEIGRYCNKCSTEMLRVRQRLEDKGSL